ncbi:hypothetical protein EJB05_19834 [Eragrostis curvula]|uniref:Phytocyanin domain-containing protein n=1 Tax=Eragrostis curvula TaxID=38414 RepID=A0A5J9UZ36_9POAL|nr:hypothetical protein EJB05_19834 [Eragrostis curvula]
MAASLHLAVFAASVAFLAASASSLPAAVFNVGDERGGRFRRATAPRPTTTGPRGTASKSATSWFKYANDSVLLVTHDDYKQCSTETPLSRFTDGDTKFTFDRFGPFYFVSGVPGHCEAGQRMIARVMAPSSLTVAPAAAPGMPPTAVVGAPTPASSSPRDAGVPSGSGSSSGAESTTPSPSPTSQASGASRRVLTAVSSSVALGLVIVSLFVLV